MVDLRQRDHSTRMTVSRILNIVFIHVNLIKLIIVILLSVLSLTQITSAGTHLDG